MKFFAVILAAVAMASAAYAEDNTATHLRVLHEGHAYAEGSKGGHEYGAGEKEEYGGKHEYGGSKGGHEYGAGEKEEYGGKHEYGGSKGGHEYGAGERRGRRNGTNATTDAATVPTPAPSSGASTPAVIGAASVAFTAVAAALY